MPIHETLTEHLILSAQPADFLANLELPLVDGVLPFKERLLQLQETLVLLLQRAQLSDAELTHRRLQARRSWPWRHGRW